MAQKCGTVANKAPTRRRFEGPTLLIVVLGLLKLLPAWFSFWNTPIHYDPRARWEEFQSSVIFALHHEAKSG